MRRDDGTLAPNSRAAEKTRAALKAELPSRHWAEIGANAIDSGERERDLRRVRDEVEGYRPLTVTVLQALTELLPMGACERIYSTLTEPRHALYPTKTMRDPIPALLSAARCILEAHDQGRHGTVSGEAGGPVLVECTPR